MKCVACCSVDNQYGLLVREGRLLTSSSWSSRWAIEPNIQWLDLSRCNVTCAALWKHEDPDTIEAIPAA